MPKLTTHVLDTMNGRPASGLRIRLFDTANPASPLAETTTDEAGRAICAPQAGPVIPGGVYDLVFSVGAHFAASGSAMTTPPFLGDVVIRFGMSADAEHYHIPLLVSPWSYTTYRGH